MSYKFNTVQELTKQKIPLDLTPEDVNPEIARDTFWDFGDKELIEKIMKDLLAARINSVNSFYYNNLFNGLNRKQITKNNLDSVPFTQKETNEAGIGIKDAEREKIFSLHDLSYPGYALIGSNTGSTGDIRFLLPNTNLDLAFEHNSMARVFSQLGITERNYIAFNFYNAHTLGADTFNGAAKIFEGVNFYIQPGFELEDIANIILRSNENPNFNRGINIIEGVSRAPGDPSGRKSPIRIEDILLDILLPAGYISRFTPEEPLICYAVGAGISQRLITTAEESEERLVVVGAYGLQEGRPLATAFNTRQCKYSNMHLTQFPYYTELLPIPDSDFYHIVLSTPIKQGAPLIKYVTEDIAQIGKCDCGRTSPVIYNIKRGSGEVLTGLGCRA